MAREKIEWAAREKKRSVNAAVGKSFAKTVTEPVTNSDSALKKLGHASHASGLVEELFGLSVGDALISSDAKLAIATTAKRVIIIEVFTAGKDNRLCRVCDLGGGMTYAEVRKNFGKYAEAKAKGQKTRSLFGRGALDVMLYHDDAKIYTVKNGVLTYATISFEDDAYLDARELGKATRSLLKKHRLPAEMNRAGTVVQFKLREGTSVPQEEQITKLASFYMLRLIAADPNTTLLIKRERSTGTFQDELTYDFPVGEVIYRDDHEFKSPNGVMLPVSILVARSDTQLVADSKYIERRENGLLFVDDNDAVLDLTLLPEYDKSPYLNNLFGIVRITGIRAVLEQRLEDDDAEAILTVSRDGFEQRSAFTQALFHFLGERLRSIYEKEEQRVRKGDFKRSKELDKRYQDALKLLSQFNLEETEGEGTGTPPKPGEDSAILFTSGSVRLTTGISKQVHCYINREKVRLGEMVTFDSTNALINVNPDSTTVAAGKGAKGKFLRIVVNLSCASSGETSEVSATTTDKKGNQVVAKIRVVRVEPAPIFVPPENIEFSAPRFNGEPNKRNRAVLLVNLDVVPARSALEFELTNRLGNVTFADNKVRLRMRIRPEHILTGHNVARVPITFEASGWGQKADLLANAFDGKGASFKASCSLRFERDQGDRKFSDFHYEDLGRTVLGDVAADKIYVNSGVPLHQIIFGHTQEDFDSKILGDPLAQMRAATVITESVAYATASAKFVNGGKKGLQVDPDDPIGSVRGFVESSKLKLEVKIVKALAPQIFEKK